MAAEGKSVRKKFDRGLYNTYDGAKEFIAARLGGSINPNRYGPDVIVEDRFVEVEVKTAWPGGDDGVFPYSDIRITDRKAKWVEMNINFIILSKDMRWACIIQPKSLRPEYRKVVSNRFVRNGEYFFVIPVEETKILEVSSPEFYEVLVGRKQTATEVGGICLGKFINFVVGKIKGK